MHWGIWWDTWQPRLSRWGITLAKAIFSTSTVSMLAAVGSAIGSGYAYQAAQQANQTAEHANAISTESATVAKLAQDFAERLYKDQLALNAPALSVTGGHIDVAAQPNRSGKYINTYTLDVTLRNSGGRDARAVFVALKQDYKYDTYKTQLDSLPKGTDIQVRLPLNDTFDPAASWTVAVAYGDDLPTHTLTSPPTTGSPTATTRVCALPVAVSLASLPGSNQSWQDYRIPNFRLLSAGAPTSAADSVRSTVLGNQRSDYACVDT